MFIRPLLRFVPDHTKFAFMRARFYGLAGSFILSTISVGLFFYPGLNLGIDFKGGIVMEAHTPGPADFNKLRAAFASAQVPAAGLQRFGAPDDILIRLDAQASPDANQAMQLKVRAALQAAQPGTQVVQADVLGRGLHAGCRVPGRLEVGRGCRQRVRGGIPQRELLNGRGGLGGDRKA